MNPRLPWTFNDEADSRSPQALARALYSRESILILDDVLTGLDRHTENFILNAVFGPQGLIEETDQTVIMATNSGSDDIPFLNELRLIIHSAPSLTRRLYHFS